MSEDTYGLAPRQRKSAIGRLIREARGSMSQSDLARRMGTCQAAVSNWENGLVDLTLERVHRIEEVLGLGPGAVAERAGYLDRSGRAENHEVRPLSRHLAEPTSSLEDPTFPERLAGEIRRLQVLMDVAAHLRRLAPDEPALGIILGTRDLVRLRLSWELWELHLLPEGLDPDEFLAGPVPRERLSRARFALWGAEGPLVNVVRSLPHDD